MLRDCLVLGADSVVGEHLVSALRTVDVSVTTTSRRARDDALFFDLAHPDLKKLDGARFDCAFICAAVTNMRSCEEASAESHKINVDGTLAVIRHLSRQGSHIVFFSSSQVFDGETPKPDESAPRNPKNVYGRQKVEVENAIVAEELPVAVVRVTKVLANRPVGMFSSWHGALLHGQPATAATNMTVAPVAADDVALAATRLADARCTGAWHLSSSDEISYYDALRRMAEICGLPLQLVRGEDLTEAQVPAIYRHRYAAIDARKIAEALDVPMRPARRVLDGLFDTYAKSG